MYNLWENNADYVKECCGTDFVNYTERYYHCPECGEPILNEDWAEHDDWDVCPICGFNFWEG